MPWASIHGAGEEDGNTRQPSHMAHTPHLTSTQIQLYTLIGVGLYILGKLYGMLGRTYREV